jgi:hypothetical protein
MAMLRKLMQVIVLTLALNFVALAGAVGWLFQSGKLDREKLHAIRELVMDTAAEEAPATQPATAPASQPVLQLDNLLAEQVGKPATEQIQFLQSAFDARLAMLERRQRELVNLQEQVELAKQQLSKDREALEADRAALQARVEQEAIRESDRGFQDALALYTSMPAKQVKNVFMTLDDETVVQFLQAMQPRTAAKIIKEFKTSDELERIRVILEQLRLAEASARE